MPRSTTDRPPLPGASTAGSGGSLFAFRALCVLEEGVFLLVAHRPALAHLLAAVAPLRVAAMSVQPRDGDTRTGCVACLELLTRHDAASSAGGSSSCAGRCTGGCTCTRSCPACHASCRRMYGDGHSGDRDGSPWRQSVHTTM